MSTPVFFLIFHTEGSRRSPHHTCYEEGLKKGERKPRPNFFCELKGRSFFLPIEQAYKPREGREEGERQH